MKSVKVVFAAAVVTAVGFARADATTESRTAGAVVRFGVVTDLHCADLAPVDNTHIIPVAGKVCYRESLRKLDQRHGRRNEQLRGGRGLSLRRRLRHRVPDAVN